MILARDSFEGLVRKQILAPRRFRKDKFVPKRYTINFPKKEGYEFLEGAKFELDRANGKFRLKDQVLVKFKNGDIQSYTLENINEIDKKALKDLPPGSIKILGINASKNEALAERLRSLGRNVSPTEPIEIPSALHGQDTEFEVFGIIDNQTWRAIAKIAFNYLAFIQGPQFVLDSKFDPIRQFITQKNAVRAMVRIIQQPILSDERYFWRSFEGHLVMFETLGGGLLGKVSLFNSITYEIILCSNLGLYLPLKSGHFCDPIKKKAKPLVALPRRKFY